MAEQKTKEVGIRKVLREVIQVIECSWGYFENFS
jgi:hypothetical protein